jgi:hypothetical protein
MFAVFLVGMMGMLGLATDLGMAYAQRRTMQNAADAGALAGARQVARWKATSPTSAGADVASMVTQNKMNTEPAVVLCDYVDYAENSQGGCGGTVPAAATGVRVRVAEDHGTFFIRVIPGAPSTVHVEAEAVAQVQRFTGIGGDAPFIVCGVETRLDDGGTFSIFSDPATGAINPQAYGKRYVIHESQSQGNKNMQVEDCDIDTSSFKGRAKPGANNGKGEGEWWYGDNGVKAGPTNQVVNGIEGCKSGSTTPYDCVVFLPVATMDPPSVADGSDRKFFVLKIMPFKIVAKDANGHIGILMESYIVSGPGEDTWCRDCDGAVVIKLTR